jgi:drug/metabolite transporter (DMT)-like permease
MLLALLASGVVAGVGGAASARRLRRGPAGANLAGLCSLGGSALVAVPLLLLGAGSGLNDTQVVLFGLAIAAISAMGGQISGSR